MTQRDGSLDRRELKRERVMCGSVSAIALEDRERELWPTVRELLRKPGRMMALMRGALGDTEVAAVAAVQPQGTVEPLAILATTHEIADEIRLCGEANLDKIPPIGVQPAKIGDYDVEVLVGEGPDGRRRPLAVLVNPWLEQYLLIFARTLWRRY
ncbi:hypothetical protein ODJ79_45350 [Actinoplanes sp. KI2]|uniref:hypothetical protein n=1 Tax=Actinoplanes sp. KI2 TaxID=2983315 RepID=UPI0021D57633|nr:hypothetical protein [Actinoplanes sp. KI2]MCU7730986.1 hypothetical protein [Actinoplanes sp. KI2]